MIGDLIRRWLSNPSEDTTIELTAASIRFNHRTKVVFIMLYDPGTPQGAYDELEAHYRKQGYFVQLFVPSVSLSRPERPQQEPD